MAVGVGMKIMGDKELMRMLGKLPEKVQRRAVRPAIRKSAIRIRGDVQQQFVGFPVGVVTGNLMLWIAGVKVVSLRTRNMIRYGFALPDDREDAIAVNALEYGWTDRHGHTHPARAAIRTAVDSAVNRETGLLKRDIVDGIERQAKRLAKKAAK